MKENAPPVFHPKRPVAYAALEDVELALEILQKLGIISPVEYSSWTAPIVVFKKANSKLRICADFSTDLNDSIESNSYPLALLEDIFSQLSGSTKIDLADAFLQMELDDESKKYLTINFYKGLFQYNRMPFGVKTAPSIFQSNIFFYWIRRCNSVHRRHFDSCKDTETMVNRLKAVLNRLKEFNLKVRVDKCKFCVEQTKYLGYVLNKKS